MSENRTHAEIIAEMRIFKCRNLETGELELCNAIANYLSDHIDAAHKREIDVLKQRCAELNAEVAAKDEVIKRLNDSIAEEQRRKMATAENPSAVGDTAKLREALKKCLLYITCAESVGIGTITINDKVKLAPKKIIKSAKEALAATEQEGGAK